MWNIFPWLAAKPLTVNKPKYHKWNISPWLAAKQLTVNKPTQYKQTMVSNMDTDTIEYTNKDYIKYF